MASGYTWIFYLTGNLWCLCLIYFLHRGLGNKLFIVFFGGGNSLTLFLWKKTVLVKFVLSSVTHGCCPCWRANLCWEIVISKNYASFRRTVQETSNLVARQTNLPIRLHWRLSSSWSVPNQDKSNQHQVCFCHLPHLVLTSTYLDGRSKRVVPKDIFSSISSLCSWKISFTFGLSMLYSAWASMDVRNWRSIRA